MRMASAAVMEDYCLELKAAKAGKFAAKSR